MASSPIGCLQDYPKWSHALVSYNALCMYEFDSVPWRQFHDKAQRDIDLDLGFFRALLALIDVKPEFALSSKTWRHLIRIIDCLLWHPQSA